MGKVGVVLAILEKIFAMVVVIMPHAIFLKRLHQVITLLKKGEAVKKEAIKTVVLAALDSCGVICPPIQIAVSAVVYILDFCWF